MRVLSRLLLLALVLWSGLSVVAAAESRPLRVGIMPFNSPLALLRTHQPLREHLQRSLNRPVELYTSSDYFTYMNEALDQKFDVLIAGPHFGAMAIERGYVALVRYKATLQPILVVRGDSPVTDIADLRGRRIGLSSRLSISSIGGVRWLEDHGLRMGRDYQISERATHGAAVAAVAVGELDAALTTHTPLNQIPADIRAQIRILPTEIQVPHLMTLAHRRLGQNEVERIRVALQAFSGQSGEGQKFFAETGYLGYQPVTAEDLVAMRPYVELTRKLMGMAD